MKDEVMEHKRKKWRAEREAMEKRVEMSVELCSKVIASYMASAKQKKDGLKREQEKLSKLFLTVTLLCCINGHDLSWQPLTVYDTCHCLWYDCVSVIQQGSSKVLSNFLIWNVACFVLRLWNLKLYFVFPILLLPSWFILAFNYIFQIKNI